MLEVYFIVRHTPFWAVPLMIISAEFGYMFWLKKKKKTAIYCLIIAFIGFIATGYYVWSGGPEKSVKNIKKLHRELQ